MDTVSASIEPVKSVPGKSEGHGEGIEYGGDTYYYRVGRRIPKDKAVALKHEGNFFGRCHGDVIHLIVAWNGKDFTVLETVYDHFNDVMKKYKNETAAGAISLAKQSEKHRQERLDALPKCKCGEILVVFADEQGDDECYVCFKKRNSGKKSR